MSLLRWTPHMEKAARLHWEGKRGTEIARQLNIGRRTFVRWKSSPAFQARIAEMFAAQRTAEQNAMEERVRALYLRR